MWEGAHASAGVSSVLHSVPLAHLRCGFPDVMPSSCMAKRMRRCTGFKPSRTSGSARPTMTDMAYCRAGKQHCTTGMHNPSKITPSSSTESSRLTARYDFSASSRSSVSTTRWLFGSMATALAATDETRRRCAAASRTGAHSNT
jgi:hypothetical protein